MSVLPTKAGVVMGADDVALRPLFWAALTGAGDIAGGLVDGAGEGNGGIALAEGELGAGAGGALTGVEGGAVGVLPGIVNSGGLLEALLGGARFVLLCGTGGALGGSGVGLGAAATVGSIVEGGALWLKGSGAGGAAAGAGAGCVVGVLFPTGEEGFNPLGNGGGAVGAGGELAAGAEVAEGFAEPVALSSSDFKFSPLDGCALVPEAGGVKAAGFCCPAISCCSRSAGVGGALAGAGAVLALVLGMTH